MTLNPNNTAAATTVDVEEVRQKLDAITKQLATQPHPKMDAFCEKVAQEIVQRSLSELRLQLASGEEHHQYRKLRKVVFIERISIHGQKWNPIGCRLIDAARKAEGFFWFTQQERLELKEVGLDANHLVWLHPKLRKLALPRINYALSKISERVRELFQEAVEQGTVHSDLAFSVRRNAYPYGTACEIKLWIEAKGADKFIALFSGGCCPNN
jgi:hypothetical protein